MDSSAIEDSTTIQKIVLLIRQNKEIAVLVTGGILMFMAGFSEWSRSRNPDTVVEIVEATPDSQGVMGGLIVDVSGAVKQPGVYRLPSDARIGDALVAAGGLADTANQEWVSKNVNLAAKVSDGSKLFIPKQGENLQTSIGEQTGSNNVAGATTININTASESELDRLSGIGPARAQTIIQNRPYTSTDELVTKKVITSAVFEEIKTEIGVY